MSIKPFLSAALPASLALKLLSKVNPKVAEFVTNSFAAGFGADQVMDFVRKKVTNPEREKLEASDSLRPDEKVSLQRIKGREMPADIAQKAVGIGSGVLGGLLGRDSPVEQAEQPEQVAAPQKPPTLTQKVIKDAENMMDEDRKQSQSFAAYLKQFPDLKKQAESGISEGIPSRIVAEELKKKRLLSGPLRRAEEKFGKTFAELLSEEYGAGEEEAEDEDVDSLLQAAMDYRAKKRAK